MLVAKGPEGEQIQIYLGKDSNPKMGATARYSKSLGAILSEHYPDKQFGVWKEDGIITCQLERLAELDVAKSDVAIRWSKQALGRYSIDKDRVTAQFREKNVIEWCS